jgi:hypothetical protein
MKRAALVVLMAAAVGLSGLTVVSAEAVGRHGGGGFHGGQGFRGGGRFHGHEFHEFHHHGFFGGPVIGFGLWADPFWYPPYTYTPPMVIQSEPQVYAQPQPQTYWYYCPDARAYYPYVQQCPSGWLTVVPTPQ